MSIKFETKINLRFFEAKIIEPVLLDFRGRTPGYWLCRDHRLDFLMRQKAGGINLLRIFESSGRSKDGQPPRSLPDG
jgi:hypothetical protein